MVGRRFAVSDLHGQLDLYNQIKEYINDNDIVYALGDFGDRGPHPWETLKAALDDPQFIYLMGNHDLILINYIKKILPWIDDGQYNNEWDVPYFPNEPLTYNGGWGTICGWVKEPNRMEYYEKLLNAPLEIRLAARNLCSFIYLTHAGRTPHYDPALNVEEFIWDRNHFLNQGLMDKDLLVFGHSPIEYVKKELDFYCGLRPTLSYEEKDGCLYLDNGHKICIDRGAHFTGETVLLDIDTLESHIFKVKGEQNGTEEN